MPWPNDADGDVFRRLESHGFDFTKEYDVDFNVDFDDWPPPAESVNLLKSKYNNVEIVEPENTESGNGYTTFQIRAKVTYELVTKTQKEVTQAMNKYRGWCESWGVLQE